MSHFVLPCLIIFCVINGLLLMLMNGDDYGDGGHCDGVCTFILNILNPIVPWTRMAFSRRAFSLAGLRL